MSTATSSGHRVRSALDGGPDAASTPNLPIDYEAAVRRADELADRLRSDPARVVQLEQHKRGHARCLEALQHTAQLQEQLATRQAELDNAWQRAWQGVAVDVRSPREMLEWRRQQQALTARAARIRELDTRCTILATSGYKCFGSHFTVRFPSGLTVLVGENASGKSALIDGIRLLLLEDEFGRAGIADTDLHRPFAKTACSAQTVRLRATFSELSRDETVAFLPWSDLQGKATLTLEVANKETKQGRYKRSMWGGASRASAFEWELFDAIDCVYLPPLRDAEAKLREGKGSRLARLLKNLYREELEAARRAGTQQPLEKRVA
ncbi:MAG: ATP-binding protein, partial [Candidatus Latescibacterota bacterium]